MMSDTAHRIELELARPVGDWPAGRRVSPGCQELGLYELHEELPIDGLGVPFDALLVVVISRDGHETKTPYREYFMTGGREARCPLCRRNTVTTGSCRAARRDPKRRAAAEKLDQLRAQWAKLCGNVEIPAHPAPLEGARPLYCGLPDVETARRLALPFAYDYEDVHVAPLRARFVVYACGFRDVLGAGADAISYDGERAWPPLRGYVRPRRRDTKSDGGVDGPTSPAAACRQSESE